MKLTTGPLILECAILNTVLITYTTLTYLFLDERKYIGGRIHDCLLALKIQIWYFGILQQENVFFKISRTISMPGVVEYIYPIHRWVVNAAAVSRDFLGLFFCFKNQSWIAFYFREIFSWLCYTFRAWKASRLAVSSCFKWILSSTEGPWW